MREITLGRSGKVALVDDEDYEWLSQWKWHLTALKYAGRNGSIRNGHPRRTIFMHRLILCVRTSQVDHINGNSLDNRRRNLRKSTQAQNTYNSAPRNGRRFKGVYLIRGKYWSARIQARKINIHLGMFPSEEAAALAYDEAALLHHGEFARLNFPDRSTPQ